MRKSLYAVTGVTGNVGSVVANTLLSGGNAVRAIGRDAAKLSAWATRGAEVAIAENSDAEAFTRALADVESLFLMLPPLYDPEPGFPTVRRALTALKTAIEAAKPGRIVFLSTVGAQVQRDNLLNALGMAEAELGNLSVPTTFLRAAWFMENAAWDVEAAQSGLISSYLQPLEHAIPMIATDDIGHLAAELMLDEHPPRIVELEAERRYSANDIATAFSTVLGRPVKTEAIPRDEWEARFRAQGMNYPLPRIGMLDGFNEGWIDFEGGDAVHRTGPTPLEKVFGRLVAVR